MSNFSLVTTAIGHVIHGRLRSLIDGGVPLVDVRSRDRGAISLEQVLWFVAAGVSVAVIAAIMWSQIRDQANTPIDTPAAP
jgi:hypothetical protein